MIYKQTKIVIMEEEWLDIENTEYEISNLGRVRIVDGRMLKIHWATPERPMVGLALGEVGEKKLKTFSLQNLVRTVFRDPTIIIRNLAKDDPEDLLVEGLKKYAIKHSFKLVYDHKTLVITDDRFVVFFSHISKKIQCYYMGYGLDTVERGIRNFSYIDEIITFINKCRKMEASKRPAIELEDFND